MKQFFYILFGGLALIVVALFAIKVGGALRTGKSSGVSASAPASAIQPVKSYSSVEEESVDNMFFGSATTTTAKAKITARGYIVMNIGGPVASSDDSRIIDSREQDTLMPIASLTKLVTAIVARQKLDGEGRVIITKKVLDTYGNTAGFKVGEIFTADDLLYPLLMVSSNDAAEAIATTYGRSAFLRAMNDFAQSIGAYRTYFADPAGLSSQSVSTAHDMAIILGWMYHNMPDVLDITLQETKTLRTHTWVNPTHLLSWSYYLGGKNGYLPEANRTGASLFRFGPVTSSASSSTPIYAVVVLGSQSRDSDVVSLVQRTGIAGR